MKSLKFYQCTTISLLLLNLGIIGFFFWTKPPHPLHKNGRGAKHMERPLEILQLDAAQHKIFDASAKAHHQAVREIGKQQRVLLQGYFESIVDTTKLVRQGEILAQVQHLERQKIEITYQHFEEVKTILNDTQKAHFAPFLKRVLTKVLFKIPQGPPPN